MIIVDTALEKLQDEGKPIKLGIIGAGYMGKLITLNITTAMKGIQVAAISNRTISKAKKAYELSGISDYVVAENITQLEKSIDSGGYAVTNDPILLCRAKGIDAVIDATWALEFGTQIAVKCFENRKHLITLNADLDATVGPILKVYADRSNVIYTGMDGDQPGAIMNLLRFVKTIGYKPVLAGNIKGLQDPYRNPDTQREFAKKHHQEPKMITSFADGTKISMEMVQVANATGFKVGKRGMYGFKANHVKDALNLFPQNEMLNGGLVDYVLGAEPGPGVFVIGYNDHPVKQQFMKYVKMGDGPFYLFYTPYHLAAYEVPLTAARAVLFNDATITPAGAPVCGVISIAKKDLEKGDVLDGAGGFTVYGEIENQEIIHTDNLLPMGLADGCILTRNIDIDQPITFDDVQLPENRLIDRLYKEQLAHFKINSKNMISIE